MTKEALGSGEGPGLHQFGGKNRSDHGPPEPAETDQSRETCGWTLCIITSNLPEAVWSQPNKLIPHIQLMLASTTV